VRCRTGMQCVESKVWPFAQEALIFATSCVAVRSKSTLLKVNNSDALFPDNFGLIQ
jgi:hypothetical protein